MSGRCGPEVIAGSYESLIHRLYYAFTCLLMFHLVALDWSSDVESRHAVLSFLATLEIRRSLTALGYALLPALGDLSILVVSDRVLR